MKKAVVSVINDLVTDQRVHRTCSALHDMGYEVTLVGRRRRKSLPLAPRAYHTHRMFLLFEKGPLFYGFFQVRLLLFLLFRKADLLVSNDLDTLWPNYRISRWKKIPLVYDTHEIFTEVPELSHNPTKKKIWKRIEARIFPKLKDVFTVNDSIADWYERAYGLRPKVVRNVPRQASESTTTKTRADLNLPGDRYVIILQGAGINIDRGAEEAVQAMQYVDNALLLIVGDGDVIPLLKKMKADLQLGEKVQFIPRQPLELLRAYTQLADIGLTLDKDTNINYRFSLPNKLFDYIQSGVPVLASNLVEVRRIVEQYNVGAITETHDPKQLAEKIRWMLADDRLRQWRENAKLAAATLNWENEVQVLNDVYGKFR